MSEQITITANEDGTFTVAEQEGTATPGDEPLNKTVGTVAEVLQVLQETLTDEPRAPADQAKAMWDEEAAKRAGPAGAEHPLM